MKQNDSLKSNVRRLTNPQKAILAQTIISNYRIKIMPDKSLLPRIGESGHNIYEAIAEFIDNAIDAMTKEQRQGVETLVINIIVNANKKFFSITDNGKGMNRETLEKAAKLGYSEKTAKDLGYAGVGMKSGALTLSNNFTVSTAVKGNLYRSEFDYDDKEWKTNTDWELPARDLIKDAEEHGTTIKINKITNIILTPAKTQYLKSDIAKRYRSFIQKGLVKIHVNGVEVQVEDVNWAEGYPIDFNIPTKYGEIYGKIGLMKESSQKGYYGFDIFRNGRMITTNSKFAIGTHPTTARISGEIHLNFAKVSHEKNKFISETPEYETAELACRNSEVFKLMLREAKKKNEEGDNKKENQNLEKELEADMPFIAHTLKELEYNAAMSLGKGTAIVKGKKGIIKGIFGKLTGKKYVPEKEEEKPDGIRQPKAKEEDDYQGSIIKHNGLTFKVNREYILDKNLGRKSFDYNDSTKVLTVYINKAYAGFRNTKDKIAYCRESVIDAIVGFIYKDHVIILDKYNETKDDLITGTLNLRQSLSYEEIEEEIETTDISETQEI